MTALTISSKWVNVIIKGWLLDDLLVDTGHNSWYLH